MLYEPELMCLVHFLVNIEDILKGTTVLRTADKLEGSMGYLNHSKGASGALSLSTVGLKYLFLAINGMTEIWGSFQIE